MRYIFVLLTMGALWAQGPGMPNIRPFEQIRQYLELTAEQILKLTQQNAELQRFQAEKARRSAMVQREIAVETRREPLDPHALGLRYAELETIRREIAEEQTKLLAANRNVLTDAQKTKLRALEEALKLVPVANQAQALNLMPGGCAPLAVGRPGVGNGGQPGIIIGNVVNNTACVGGIIGDFIPAIP
jgi:hypothetical protein